MNITDFTTIKRPHIGQQEVFLDRKRFNVVSTGRRWGKEELINQLINESIQKGHKRILILAPLKLSYIAFRRVIVNGLYIQFAKTEDYFNVLGNFQGDRIIINEPDFSKKICECALKLSQISLSDFSGDLYVIGTPIPKEQENDLPSVFKILSDKYEDSPYWKIFKCSTMQNPSVQYSNLKQYRESLTHEQYSTQFEGVFN